MRKSFEPQLTLGCTPIEEVEIPPKTKSHLAALAASLQYIYVHPEWNQRIFGLLTSKICQGKKATGRQGMSLWELFVLAQVRLCQNISYEDLQHTANYDTMIRGIMGVLPTDYSLGQQYEYQNIYDNVSLLDDESLQEINDVIVEVGHHVFKKKGKTAEEAPALHCKTDSFVVETDTHFPTDYNLLWDSARKCIAIAEKLRDKGSLKGWRKSGDWHKSLKGLMRTVGKISSKGGANKDERLQKATTSYLVKASELGKKVDHVLHHYQPADTAQLAALLDLNYYHQMLVKHIDLVDRRLLQGETIPHEEKLFSIFQPYTEWINKGKQHPSVEIGKKLAITTDQHHLIIDWQLAENQADNQLTVEIGRRIASKYTIQSLSTDRGFSDQADKEELQTFIPEVIMPKKGKCNQQEKALESSPSFIKLKNKHSAIESNINELEHRGLDRCPNRTRRTFNSYIGLAVTAYNLHKIGRKLLADRLKQEKAKASRLAA
jgi:hypothetical protein